MKSAALQFLLLSTAFLNAAGDTTDVIRCAHDLQRAIYDDRNETRRFDFEATVTYPSRLIDGLLAIEDESGPAVLHERCFWPENRLRTGDRIHIRGGVAHSHDGKNYASSQHIRILSHDSGFSPVKATFADVNKGLHFNRTVRLEGLVLDAFPDEIDANFAFLVLTDGHETVCVSSCDHEKDVRLMSKLIGATVSLSGICTDYRLNNSRKVLGSDISINGLKTINVLKPAPEDPFDVPMLQTKAWPYRASENSLLRHMKIRGVVLATWHGNRMVVRTGDAACSNVQLTERRLPPCGAFIEAVGLPETDFFRWNLTRARWRVADGKPETSNDAPVAVTAGFLMTDESGSPQIRASQHGRLLKMTGCVQSIPAGTGDGCLILLCDGHQVAVDCSSAPDALAGLEQGCQIEVCGVCVMETESWRPQAPFPHVEGFRLAVRTPKDIRILVRPPWWTPARLTAVIVSLLAGILAVLVWNRILQKLVERKGRQLYREQVAHAGSEMRIEERTRLAVELHDSISQNLTGISMQIDAAGLQLERHPEKTRAHLDIASRTLDSCRTELRNCIWDLRNQTLDEKDMDKVLHRTLQPHVEGAALAIRFNVPRTRLSENTTHALIRIIRELATNAVRHGKASRIRIAGTLEADRLLFSVADDGCGFDPSSRPGTAEGHFGLQGVHERIRQLHGSVVIDSAPGRGTKVTVQLPTHLGEKRNG